MLRRYIYSRLSQKPLLLMTHTVIGFPNYQESFRLVNSMVTSGADLIELQIPCKDTNLDGKLITEANQQALQQTSTVEKCLSFAHTVIQRHRIPFIFVVYKSSLDHYGWLRFINNAAQIGIRGIIIPDLPRKLSLYYQAMAETAGTTLIPVIFPSSSSTELDSVKHYQGFCYCTTCDNVTGSEVQFNRSLQERLSNLKQTLSPTPVATGFGIKSKDHVELLKGCTDIAVIGTHVLQLYMEMGINGVEHFIEDLHQSICDTVSLNYGLIN